VEKYLLELSGISKSFPGVKALDDVGFNLKAGEGHALLGEDGAPYWAIVPPPPERLGGPLVDLEARRLSKPVARKPGTSNKP